MSRIGDDAWQRAPHEAVSFLDRDDPGPRDDESLNALRRLLRALYEPTETRP